MTLALSTKMKLLSVLEDIELLSKSLFDALATTPGLPNPPELNCDSLVEQLRQKEAELHQLRLQAAGQQLTQARISQLRLQLEQRDLEIGQFQRNLKEADRLLTVAIYYSRQKLESLRTARQNPVDSEELVKFAHRISASSGVMAPLGWGLGDPRRPYPTPQEMDRGFLRHIDEAGNFRPEITEEVAASTVDKTAAAAAVAASGSGGRLPPAVSGSPQHQPVAVAAAAAVTVKPEPSAAVEAMSSDSSSSSSSED